MRVWHSKHERAPARAKQELLKAAVEQINAYDAEHGGFIETPEREALMICLEDIAFSTGLGEMTEKLNDWRDW